MADNKKADEVAELKEQVAKLQEMLQTKAGITPPAKKREVVLTEAGSHVAVKRGHAAGRIIEVGEAVPAGVPVSDYHGEGYEGWMVPADEVETIAEAVEQAAEEAKA